MVVINFFRDLLGFRKNSPYVKNYLNDANIRSSIYMAFIIVVLEIWLIIRQTTEYIIPDWDNAMLTQNAFQYVFSYISYYLLFIVVGASMFLFALFYYNNKLYKKAEFITNIITASISILWIFFLIPQDLGKTTIDKFTTVFLYSLLPLMGSLIISHSIYKRLKNKNNTYLAISIIVVFAAVCLVFGIKFGYSDFISKSRPKMIICFLTMILFVACLLIWKPYISIIILTTIFVIFSNMLKNYSTLEEGNRIFLDGDEINYITFLISLTMVTISVYQQRVTEALKDERLIHDAVFDDLSGIHNIKHFYSNINLHKELNNDYYNNKICLFINIFNFRTINDQKGFQIGDEFICNLAKKTTEIFKLDHVSRISDDHIVVLTSIDGFMDKIDILKEEVKKLSNGLFVQLKVGGCKPNNDESLNRTIDKARYACGLIKRNPEITYIEYDDKMDDRFKKRQYIMNHLEEAIEKEWIKPFYQPVVWSDTKELCGAEALARWIDPTYGFLSPADFIPLLEDVRLIHKLDEHIINMVCKNMRQALDENKTVVPVSINFSRLDFELMDVIQVLKNATEKYNINKDYIHVEITESALAYSIDILNNIITTLKKDGYAIWLDDFGSGYSSLNVLKDFMFDVIKIDMKFLSNFEKNERTKDILDCIIMLANRLGMKTLTEGVETKEEADFLNEIGCGRLQGYLFGKPFKLEEFEEKIENKELIVSKKIL